MPNESSTIDGASNAAGTSSARLLAHASVVADAHPSSVSHVDGLELHLSSTSSSGYRGVARAANVTNPYLASCRGKHLGYFPTAVDAAVAYAKHFIVEAAAKELADQEGLGPSLGGGGNGHGGGGGGGGSRKRPQAGSGGGREAEGAGVGMNGAAPDRTMVADGRGVNGSAFVAIGAEGEGPPKRPRTSGSTAEREGRNDDAVMAANGDVRPGAAKAGVVASIDVPTVVTGGGGGGGRGKDTSGETLPHSPASQRTTFLCSRCGLDLPRAAYNREPVKEGSRRRCTTCWAASRSADKERAIEKPGEKDKGGKLPQPQPQPRITAQLVIGSGSGDGCGGGGSSSVQLHLQVGSRGKAARTVGVKRVRDDMTSSRASSSSMRDGGVFTRVCAQLSVSGGSVHVALRAVQLGIGGSKRLLQKPANLTADLGPHWQMADTSLDSIHDGPSRRRAPPQRLTTEEFRRSKEAKEAREAKDREDLAAAKLTRVGSGGPAELPPPAGGMDADRTFLCSRCKLDLPRSAYNRDPIKEGSRRRCKPCVTAAAAEEATTWVQCEACEKWRRLVDKSSALPEHWTCMMSTDPLRANCDVPQEDWSEDEWSGDEEEAAADQKTRAKPKSYLNMVIDDMNGIIQIGSRFQAELPQILYLPSVRRPSHAMPPPALPQVVPAPSTPSAVAPAPLAPAVLATSSPSTRPAGVDGVQPSTPPHPITLPHPMVPVLPLFSLAPLSTTSAPVPGLSPAAAATFDPLRCRRRPPAAPCGTCYACERKATIAATASTPCAMRRVPSASSGFGGAASDPAGARPCAAVAAASSSTTSAAAAAAAAAANRRRRRNRCGTCKGCMRNDCGTCVACKDRPKFGGRGIKKQACELRVCTDWEAPPGVPNGGDEQSPMAVEEAGHETHAPSVKHEAAPLATSAADLAASASAPPASHSDCSGAPFPCAPSSSVSHQPSVSASRQPSADGPRPLPGLSVSTSALGADEALMAACQPRAEPAQLAANDVVCEKPPTCACSLRAHWQYDRWWCPREPGCGFEHRVPPSSSTPLCHCGLRAIWETYVGHFVCGRGRSRAQGGCGFEAAAEREPCPPVRLELGSIDMEHARGIATKLTAVAYGLGEFAFVAPSRNGLGLYSRSALKRGQAIVEYSGPRLPLSELRHSTYALELPGSGIFIDGNYENSVRLSPPPPCTHARAPHVHVHMHTRTSRAHAHTTPNPHPTWPLGRCAAAGVVRWPALTRHLRQSLARAELQDAALALEERHF